jgi:hypothetical protein
MKNMPKPFKIRLTKPIHFTDVGGSVVHRFNVGDLMTATVDTGHYYVTSLGGIYHDEAEKVN